MSMPEDYRGKFIAQLHNALSDFTGTDVDDEEVRWADRQKWTKWRTFWFRSLLGIPSKVSRKRFNFTIETRPDYCLRPRPYEQHHPSLILMNNKSNAPIWPHTTWDWSTVHLRRCSNLCIDRPAVEVAEPWWAHLEGRRTICGLVVTWETALVLSIVDSRCMYGIPFELESPELNPEQQLFSPFG